MGNCHEGIYPTGVIVLGIVVLMGGSQRGSCLRGNHPGGQLSPG